MDPGDASIEELYANAQEGARAWTRARAMLRAAKTDRGFFQQGAGQPQGASRGRGRGKGKGRGGSREPFSGKCLRRGLPGHRARDCRAPTPTGDPPPVLAGSHLAVPGFSLMAAAGEPADAQRDPGPEPGPFEDGAADEGPAASLPAGRSPAPALEAPSQVTQSASNDDRAAFEAMLVAGKSGPVTLDCGATSSIGGAVALTDLADAGCDVLKRDAEGEVDTDSCVTFKFGNGARQATIGRATLPAQLGASSGTLSFHVLGADSPALLGMDFLRRSRAVVDFGQETARFLAVGPETHALERLPSGHLALRVVPRSPPTSPVERA